jgi:undecaprenyl-diphosphatase
MTPNQRADARFTGLHLLLALLPLVLVLVWLGQLRPGDEALWVFFKLHRRVHPLLTSGLDGFTDLLNPALDAVFVCMLVIGLRRGERPVRSYALRYVVFKLAVAFCLIHVLKYSLGQPRPGVDALFNYVTVDGSFTSLPSGHTAEAACAVVALALWRRHAPLTLGLGLLLALQGFSRVYLAHHHVADVAFGMAFGAAAGWGVWLFRPWRMICPEARQEQGTGALLAHSRPCAENPTPSSGRAGKSALRPAASNSGPSATGAGRARTTPSAAHEEASTDSQNGSPCTPTATRPTPPRSTRA